jgi:hypothetical protein
MDLFPVWSCESALLLLLALSSRRRPWSPSSSQEPSGGDYTLRLL